MKIKCAALKCPYRTDIGENKAYCPFKNCIFEHTKMKIADKDVIIIKPKM